MVSADAVTDLERGFVSYHEPTIIQILTIISFFTFLSVGEWLSNKVFRAGLIGQIVVGLIYGLPIGNVLELSTQQTFVKIGYIGLILIIFEGALALRLDLLKRMFMISFVVACVGVIAPIGLSYAFLYAGMGYGAIETFIVGAALSVTSLGTTFVVLGKASKEHSFNDTTAGTVLLSAAVFDDVSGLVMASVIDKLGRLSGDGTAPNLGWLIGRPVVASAALAIFTPLLGKYLLAPTFRRFLENQFPRYQHTSNILFMLPVLCAFLSIAAFGGTSVLYGSFLAGAFLMYLPSKHPDGPFVAPSREEAEQLHGKTPNFLHTFEKYFLDTQKYILEPMFFASIGFAIPFKELWQGKLIWQGIVYTIFMLIGKVMIGMILPVWSMFTRKRGVSIRECLEDGLWPGLLVGFAMVARGEIGLLIIQIGLNKTPYMGQDAFIVAVWAIVLNTIIGPVAVGFVVKYRAKTILASSWGLVEDDLATTLAGSRSVLSTVTDTSRADTQAERDEEDEERARSDVDAIQPTPSQTRRQEIDEKEV